MQNLDVIRGRRFDAGMKFLPDGLTLPGGFEFLGRGDQRFISQVQGRTYANMLGLLRLAGIAPERQAPFLRLDASMAACMPAGYRFVADPQVVAGVLHRRSAWSLLALTCLVDLLALAHYRQGMEPDAMRDPLWKELMQLHLKKEFLHANADEPAWRVEDARLDGDARDRAVGDLINLIGTVDGVLQAQARADTAYFARSVNRKLSARELVRIDAGLLHAYRWQYILSGVQSPHFSALLSRMLNGAQYGRIAAALAPLFDAAAVPEVRAAA